LDYFKLAIGIRASKTEEKAIIKGLLEPIVDEETFSILQDILEGRKTKNKLVKILSDKMQGFCFLYFHLSQNKY